VSSSPKKLHFNEKATVTIFSKAHMPKTVQPFLGFQQLKTSIAVDCKGNEMAVHLPSSCTGFNNFNCFSVMRREAQLQSFAI